MLALCLWTQPASAADDLMESQLVGQARYWQKKSREDLAADVWRKLLRSNPTHPEALVKLGVIEVRAGNLREAEELYSRATRLSKPPAGLSQLSASLGVAKIKSGNTGASHPEPEPSKPVPAKPVESAIVITPNKPVESEQKAQTPAASALSKAGVNKNPAQKTEADSLSLKFSNSMGIAR